MHRSDSRSAGVLPLLVLVLTACDASSSVLETSVEACPVVTVAEAGVYPRISYVTFLVDGEVVIENQRQLHRGSHHTEVIDTVPSPLDSMEAGEIAGIEIFKPQQAQELGVCPGVVAVVVSTKRAVR